MSTPEPRVPSAAWAPPGSTSLPGSTVPPGTGAPSAPSAGWAPPGAAYGEPAASVNGMAVASLVLGLFGWCLFVPGILAVVFGNLALGAIAESAGRQKGRGLAIAGIVLGWIAIALLGALAVAWLVYGLSNL